MKSRIKENSAYYLDEFDDDDPEFKKLVPLTKKNRDLIEACVRLDSSYKSDLTDLVKDMVANYNSTTILAVLKDINGTNSTRLSDETMKKVAENMPTKWSELGLLVSKLDGSVAGAKSLFEGIVESVGYDAVSFASKVIFYLSDELKKLGYQCFAHDQYSKYDSKVAACLADYTNVYDILASNGKRYCKIWFTQKRHKMFCNNANKCDDLWDFYMYYNDCLGKLLEEVQKIHKYTLTRAELDHVIWYTQK